MGLVLLALLCLGQPDVPTVSGAASGGASISLERHGEAAALLRITGKAQALEVRAGRPVLVKYASGNPALLPPEAVFLLLGRALPADSGAAFETVSAPQASANQPRAPPTA
ncbi:hypothetical protein GA829_19825 [Mesorhizobium sp. INR15]|nr:hypothetical protein GA829_19825 [Mesorhizobium sp. INR15]